MRSPFGIVEYVQFFQVSRVGMTGGIRRSRIVVACVISEMSEAIGW